MALTMTAAAQRMRLPWESMQEAARRLALPASGELHAETITDVWHQGQSDTNQGAVTGLAASANTSSGFTLTWTIAGTSAEQVWVRVHQVGKPDYVSTVQELDGLATSVDITGLPSDATFDCAVVASSVFGATKQQIFTATTA